MHIRAFMKDIAPRAAVVLGMLLMCSASAQEPARAPWWDADWARRFVVRTVPQGRRGGLNVARFNLGEQSDLCQPDGRDVRVVTPDGQPVPCEVRLRNNRTLDVLFAVREADTYFLYYSNPDAEEPALEWPERRTGGLTLETRSLSRPVRAPENLEARWEDAGESFGSRSWGRVYDLENPFGRDDFYISRYEGTLYCPQDGSYLFSINADDCAALWLGDRQQPLCVRSPGTPSSSWQDPRHPEATVRTELEEGIYRIRYYHAERFGSQLAALGWKEPTSELIETIPQDAYATYLPSSVEARQSRDGKPTPYFVADHRYNLAVRGVEHQFPHYWFEVRWPAAPKADDGQEWTYHWDFGDGSTATGRGVDHEFGSLETRRVTLTAVRGNERRSITRPLSPPARPVRHMRLDMRVRPESRVIDPEDGVKLQVLLRNDSQFRRRVTLRSRGPRGTENESPTARTPSRRREITLPGGQPGLWSALSWEFSVRSRNSLVDIELRLHDHTVASTTVSMLHTDAPLGQLNCGPGGELRDGRGRQVVLVRQAVDGDALPTRRLSTGGSSTVRMVVVETGSGLPAAGDRHEGIVEFFQRCMARRYPTLEFNMVRRATGSLDGGGEDWAGFVRAYRAVMEANPDLVLLIYRPDTLLQGAGERTAARRGSVLLQQVLTQTRAGALAIGPPPLPGYREQAAELNRWLGLVCRVQGIPLAGRYRPLIQRRDRAELFRTQTRWGTISFLSPSPGARNLLAGEACRTAVDALGEHFETAAREAGTQDGSTR